PPTPNGGRRVSSSPDPLRSPPASPTPRPGGGGASPPSAPRTRNALPPEHARRSPGRRPPPAPDGPATPVPGPWRPPAAASAPLPRAAAYRLADGLSWPPDRRPPPGCPPRGHRAVLATSPGCGPPGSGPPRDGSSSDPGGHPARP